VRREEAGICTLLRCAEAGLNARALSEMDASGHPAEIAETALEYILRKCYVSVSKTKCTKY